MITNKLRNKVKETLKHLWMSRAHLARKAGVKYSTIGMFLSGKGGLSFEHGMAIAKALEINVDAL